MFDGLAISSHSATAVTAQAICECFNREFADSLNTVLLGGADEPLYQPAGQVESQHRIYFREDYCASALHEVAHWCIAGPQRRLQLDYGYWYAPDGRSAGQQRAFERVEAQPQALEWIFAQAAGLPFRISADNLDGEVPDLFPFKLAVWQQVQQLARRGLNQRAERFRLALANRFGGSAELDAGQFLLIELC